MRIAPPQSRAYTYRVTVAAAELPVSLDKVKINLGIPVTNTDNDELLTSLIAAATSYGEKYTRRDFIEKTYETYRDFFPVPAQNEGYYSGGLIASYNASITNFENIGYEIRKSPLVSVSEITYVDNAGNPQTVTASDYYATLEADYSEVLTTESGNGWPTDAATKMQVITITFIAGLAPDQATFEANYPGLCQAIVAHVTAMFANRGDCSDSACAGALPAISKAIYKQCRIENL